MVRQPSGATSGGVFLATLDSKFANHMSIDVATASLRLRLFEDDNVNGWPRADGSTAEEWGAIQLATRPAFPGTRWALYVQRPGFGRNVRQQDLDVWDLSEDDAFQHADVSGLGMAVVFELVVNFGSNRPAADRALATLVQHPTVLLRGLDVPIAPGHLTEYTTSGEPDYIELSVSPQRIRYGGEQPDDPVNARTLQSQRVDGPRRATVSLLGGSTVMT